MEVCHVTSASRLISIPTASDLAAILKCLQRCRSSLRHQGYISQAEWKMLRQINQIHRHLGKYPLKTLKLLVKMNFPLPRYYDAWLINYFHLAAFHRKEGHFRVPWIYKPCPSLQGWIRKQRNDGARLEASRKELLDRLEPAWCERMDFSFRRWTGQYQKLKAFKARYGHSRVPYQWTQDRSLALWVSKQRILARKHHLSENRRALLKALDFDWEPFQNAWFKHYRQLVKFWKKHGHCQVPRKDPLELWVKQLRVNKCRLSRDKIRLLDEMGFDWSPRESRKAWYRKKMLEALETFVKASGHARIPHGYKTCPSLRTWVTSIRIGRIRLPPHDVQRLKALGFVWSVLDWRWKQNLAKLKDFKRRHGHLPIPSKDKSLAQFCVKMRMKIRRGTLPKERLEQLQKLGFV